MGKDTAKSLVTVLTPTYRRPRLLAETIESVLAQTFKDFIYVVGSDGWSDPETERVVLDFMKRDGRVFYLKGPHLGQFKHMNRLLSWAGSKYVAILSDDDMWEPRFLELCVNALERHPGGALAYSDWSYLVNGEKTAVIESERCNLTLDGLRTACRVNTSATLISKAALDGVFAKYGYHYDPRIRYTCGDWSFWLRLWGFGRFVHVHENLSAYRMHASQITNTRPLLFTAWEEYLVRRHLADQDFKMWLPAVVDKVLWPILVRVGWLQFRHSLKATFK